MLKVLPSLSTKIFFNAFSKLTASYIGGHQMLHPNVLLGS